MAVASLVLGIVSIVLSFIVNWIGAIPAIIGIILGALGRKDPAKKGMATGGLVCSIIGFILSIILLIACAACVSAAGAY